MRDYHPPTTSYAPNEKFKHKTTRWERIGDWSIIATAIGVILFVTLLRSAH